MNGITDPILIARAEEQLRQEREAFDEQKRQHSRWFTLRLTVGYVAVGALVAIIVVCVYIFVNHREFPAAIVTAASAAFFGDVVGLIVMVWRVVLGSSSSQILKPTTRQATGR